MKARREACWWVTASRSATSYAKWWPPPRTALLAALDKGGGTALIKSLGDVTDAIGSLLSLSDRMLRESQPCQGRTSSPVTAKA